MGIEAMEPDFAVLVTQAEASVAAVKDPDLRRVAFEKVLSTLLERHGGTRSAPAAARQTKATSSPQPDAKPTAGKRDGPKGQVERLISDGFFKQQRTIGDVKSELGNHGFHYPVTSLSPPLQRLTRERKLRREKVTRADGKVAFAYSEW